jgi:hypothetical protein
MAGYLPPFPDSDAATTHRELDDEEEPALREA